MRSASAKEKKKAIQKQPPQRELPKKRSHYPSLHSAATKMSAGVGSGLREARQRAGISVRELARRIHVSASLISQIERDRTMPSVSTLFTIANELGLVLDDLFKNSERRIQTISPDMLSTSGVARGPVQRSRNRNVIRLRTGVRWERLTPTPDDELEFLYVVYDVGGASCEDDSLFRHGGKEYGYVVSGRLGIQIGFETYELGPGDSLSFDAQEPHRLWTIGLEPVVAIFAILRRHNDSRSAAGKTKG